MPEVTFTQEDIVSTKEVTAGWYPLTLKQVVEGPGKKDPSSTTWSCTFEVIDGESKGLQVLTWFSSKMMKNIIRFIRCFVASPVAGTSYSLDSTVGKPVMGYLVWDIDNQTNIIKDFKPVGK